MPWTLHEPGVGVSLLAAMKLEFAALNAERWATCGFGSLASLGLRVPVSEAMRWMCHLYDDLHSLGLLSIPTLLAG